MRKRAAIDRHFPLQWDALEERTLLSTVVAVPDAGPSPAVFVEHAKPLGDAPANAPSFTIGAPAWDSFAASPALFALSREVNEHFGAGAPGLESYSAAMAKPLPGGLAIPAFSMGGGGQAGGKSGTLMAFNLSADSSESPSVYGHDAAWNSSGAIFAPIGANMAMAFVASRSAQDNFALSGPFHLGLVLNLPAWHGDAALTLDGTKDVLRELMGAEPDVYQSVQRADLPSAGSNTLQGDLGRVARDEFGLPPTAGTPAVASTAARVAPTGHTFVPALERARDSERPVVPVGDVPLASFGSVSAAVVQAASAAGSALGSIVAGRVDPQPAVAQAMVQPGNGDATSSAPEPQGLGLIAEVLPFDGNTVAAAIDRFFDRFEDPSADQPERYEPAGLTPPPGAVLIAVVAAEVARRHIKRRRDDEAAARPRRGNVEGLRFEESFGSSGPWSSRLS